MSFIVLAWLGSFLYGLEVVVSKAISKSLIANPWLFNFVWSLAILLYTVPLAFHGGLNRPRDWSDLVWAGLSYTLSGIFYILALYRLDISTLSPLFNLRTALSVLLGVFFLGETLNSFQVSLIVLILLMGLLVTYEEHWHWRKLLSSGLIFAFLDMVVLSLMGLFVKKSVIANGYWTTTLLTPLLSQFLLLLTWPKFANDWPSLHLREIGVTALVALFGALASLSVFKAYGQNLGLTTVILSLPLSMFMAFFLSLFWPGYLEKNSLKVYLLRFTSAMIMVAAAVKLSLG